MKTYRWLFLLTGLTLALSACSGPQLVKSGGIQLEPQPAGPIPSGPPPEPGSLWTTRSSAGLLTDHRARNVGDIVTITIAEETKASGIAQTQADRASGVEAGIGALFGITKPMNPFSDATAVADKVVQADVGLNSKGYGKTERQSTVTTYLPAQVIQVLPNGNLVIKGHRNIRINNETQIMTISGMVRTKDINQYNQVASNQVAEVRMEISGIGVISDKQRQGWFTRIFDHVWPF